MGGDDRATERNAQADARGAGECRIICIRVRTLTRQGPRGAPPTGRSGSPQSRASPARAGRAVPAAWTPGPWFTPQCMEKSAS